MRTMLARPPVRPDVRMRKREPAQSNILTFEECYTKVQRNVFDVVHVHSFIEIDRLARVYADMSASATSSSTELVNALY